jgi:predicted transcriptional regulator
MTLTVRPDLEKKLAAVAGQRDPQTVLDDMIATSVAREERIIASIRKGQEEARKGLGTPHDEVFDRLEKKLREKYGSRV